MGTNILSDVMTALKNPTNWQGSQGYLHQIWQHIIYSGLSVGIAALAMIPLGIIIGASGYGRNTVTLSVTILRAFPSLGLLTALILWWGLSTKPLLVTFVALAAPSILMSTFIGVSSIDRSVFDGARGVGFGTLRIMIIVAAPLSVEAILTGVRSAALQVIATLTIAGYFGLGGLGRVIFSGLSTYNYAQMFIGALLVAIIALLVEGALSLIIALLPQQLRMSAPR